MNAATQEPPSAKPTRRLALILACLLAIGFALVALWLLGVAFNLRTANSLLETERDLARISDRLARSQLEERTYLAEKIITELNSRPFPDDLSHLRVAALAAPAATAPDDSRATVVWDPARKTGLLVLENPPSLPSGEILQLWIESPSRAPMSVATFEPDARNFSASFALTEAPADFDAFRLTRETSPAPTKPGERVIGVAKISP